VIGIWHPRHLTATAALIAAVLTACILPARADENLWTALRKGTHVAMMRHALAPGTGDPANFTLQDCSTQRNLDDTGRRQAAAIGTRFRSNGIAKPRIYSSQWCRCLETAELLNLGDVTLLPALNSFFRDREKGPSQTAEIKKFLSQKDDGASIVLVTHQVNITALTNVFPASGEIVVVRIAPDGTVEVAGRIATAED